MFYDLYEILNELDLSFNEFQELCCISGTDYNINKDSNIFNNLEHLKSINVQIIRRTYKMVC